MMKRVFDLILSSLGIFILWPFYLLISFIIIIDDPGPIFFIQKRVGKGGKLFGLIKFRTMRVNAEKRGFLTVGDRDNRITRVGYYLRKFKIDELPQLINVVKGDMSLVGPRPEVLRYVNMYTAEQRKVLDLKPGITDHASIEYINENEILAKSDDPEKTYVEEVMPKKLEMNLAYIRRRNLVTDLGVILKTILKIVS